MTLRPEHSYGERQEGASSSRRLVASCILSLLLGAAHAAAPAPSRAASLSGSSWSVNRQAEVAEEHSYTRLKTPSEVRKFAELGLLVRVSGNADYELSGVSFPYARPEVKLFIDRLAGQYKGATGEKLVVTSLTRPLSKQPRNASRHSVHTTGMAVDIRRPQNRKQRTWLEKALLELETRGVLDATHEKRPPHYHVAVFPSQYAAYVEKMTGEPSIAGAEPEPPPRPAPQLPASRTDTAAEYMPYRVAAGDSLWGIAKRFGTSVDRIRSLNGIPNARIKAGQTLMVPAR